MAWTYTDSFKSFLQRRIFGEASEGSVLETSRQKEDRAFLKDNAAGHACLQDSFNGTDFQGIDSRHPNRYRAVGTSYKGDTARVDVGGTKDDPHVDVHLTSGSTGESAVARGLQVGSAVRVSGNREEVATAAKNIKEAADNAPYSTDREFYDSATTAAQIAGKALDCVGVKAGDQLAAPRP